MNALGHYTHMPFPSKHILAGAPALGAPVAMIVELAYKSVSFYYLQKSSPTFVPLFIGSATSGSIDLFVWRVNFGVWAWS